VHILSKRLVVLQIAAFLLIELASARNFFAPGLAPWIGELFLTAGVALAARCGWGTGIVALAMVPLVLAGDIGFTAGHALGEMIGNVAILVAVAIASRSVNRYRRSEAKLRVLLASMDEKAEKKYGEQLLHESEERFRLLARATNDAVWDLDFETGQVWRGDGYMTLFGYTPEAIASTPEAWEKLIHPNDRQRILESFRQAIDAGQLSWSEEYRIRRADGTFANILDRGYIVRDETTRPTRMVGAATDITERTQLAEQLAQAKRVSSLGRIAASIAHEFNNVLMGIQPNLEVVRRRASGDLSKPIEHILHAVQRGKRVTDEILRFTRPSEPALQCVEVAPFLADWAQETRSLLGENVRLSVEVEQSDLHIAADPHQIAQVLTNLAINARDAMEGRWGDLCIMVNMGKSYGDLDVAAVKTPAQHVHFRISDDGIGMTREQLAHVFEPLFTTKTSGTGLGLAVSYQLVSTHGGMIFAESEAGRGTTFHILLPASSPLLELDCHAPDVAISAHRRILIVEDESAVAAGIAALLELQGVQVDLVTLGSAAVPAIENRMPDAVVLDIGLPDISGLEVYTRIADRWPQLPVVFSSGHANPAHLEEYLRKPNVSILVKPYEFDALLQVLGEVGPSSMLAAAS